MAESNLRIPKRNPKTLRRPRLLDHLHNNAHRKLSFVCAPAGYGKTTLLVDFAEDVDGDIFWYRITEQDTSLAIFFDKLIRSFQSNVPGFGEELTRTTKSHDQSPRVLATALVSAVEQSIGEYGFLILDDYHTVSHCAEIVEFLDYFLEILPDQLRIVIGSRSVYGIPTAALYIQEQLAVIGTSELAFRPEELKDLCSQYYHINLTEEQTERIIEEAEGWIVAILLALRSEGTTLEIPRIAGARDYIYNYLASDVVSALDEHLKNFMLATSVVDEFSIALANHLLGIENAGGIIKELEELNLFLSDIENEEGAVYRYHQLFADFLRQQLVQTQSSRVKLYHSRAAEWFQENANIEQAVSHYFFAGEVDRAAGLIDRTAQQYYLSGQIHTLKIWHDQLSQHGELYKLTPVLLLALAKHAITHGDYPNGAELLDLSEEPLLERQDYGTYVNWLVTRGMLQRFTGKYRGAMDAANQAQQLVESYDLDRMYWNQAERLKGIASYYLGNYEDAFTFLEQAAAGFRDAIENQSASDQIHDLLMTLADIGHFGIERGRIFETQRSFREAVELTKEIPGNYTNIAIAFNNYAYLNYLLGDYVKAWRNYAQGIEATKIYQLDRYKVHIMNGQADVLREIGEYESARDLYERAMETAEELGEKFALVDAYSGLIEVETETGFFNKAQYYVREIARVQNQSLSSAEHSARQGKVFLAMAQLELAKESYTSAIAEWGNKQKPNQAIVSAFFHYAVVLFRIGEQSEAIDYMRRCFEMAAELGYDQFLVVAARKYQGLLEHVAQEWETPQLNSLLVRIKQTWEIREQLEAPEEAPISVENILQVSAFGRETVRLDGELVPNTKWHSVGARAMFFFILDRKMVTKEQIALEFWPEFSQGKVNSNFHATLWRVRNALGGKHMIEYHGDAYRVNPEVNLHYDVDRFQQLVKRLNDRSSGIEQRTLLRQIVELYQGDYLVSIDMPWADHRRFELQTDFMKALSILAQIELDRKNYPEAEGLFARLVKLEPYRDDFHLSKMVCMVGRGDINGARQHYRSYRQFLSEELGIEPDRQLIDFYESL